MLDPFAAAPADEAQAVQSDNPISADAIKAAADFGKALAEKNVATVSKSVATSEGKITVTFKGGLGFDAPWIVVHAADLQDAHNQVSDENAALLASLMTQVQKAGKHFAGLYTPNTTTTPSAPAAQSVSAPPAGATAPPSGETRSCKHGAMTYKSGVAKASGKPWQAFMCPTPKGAPDQCPAEWIR